MTEKKKSKSKKSVSKTTNKNTQRQSVIVNVNTGSTRRNEKSVRSFTKANAYLGGTSGRGVNYPMIINNMMPTPTPIPMMMPNLETNKLNSLENSIKNIHSDIQGIYGHLHRPTPDQVQRTLPYLSSQTKDIMTEASKTKTFDTPKWGNSSSSDGDTPPAPPRGDQHSMDFTYNPLTQTRLKSSFTHNTTPAQSMQETEDNINQGAMQIYQPPINQYGIVEEPLTSVRASNNSVSMGVSQANPMSIQTVQNQEPLQLEPVNIQQALALPPIPSQTSLSSGIYNPSSIDAGSVKSSKGSIMYDSFASPHSSRPQSYIPTEILGSTRRTSQHSYPPTEVQGGDTEGVQPASSEETVEGTPPPQQAEAGPSEPPKKKSKNDKIINSIDILEQIENEKKQLKLDNNYRKNEYVSHSNKVRKLYIRIFGDDGNMNAAKRNRLRKHLLGE